MSLSFVLKRFAPWLGYVKCLHLHFSIITDYHEQSLSLLDENIQNVASVYSFSLRLSLAQCVLQSQSSSALTLLSEYFKSDDLL